MQKVITVTTANYIDSGSDLEFVETTYPELDKLLVAGYLVVDKIVVQNDNCFFSITFVLQKR